VKYRNLGRSGLSVSELCLGTMNFGPQADVPTSHQIMNTAIDKGINFFDTADRYGGDTENLGWTEEIMGEWFSQDSTRREKVVLATKLYVQMDPYPNNRGLSALHIRRACEASLKRLKVDYIDLYQMHHIDRDTPWDEIWQAMDVLVQQGKILYVGSSNFGGWHIAQAQERAKSRNFMGLISEQSIYNLLTRDIEREVIPAALDYGLGILPWSPLNGGILGGVIKKERDGKRRLNPGAAAQVQELRPQLEEYENYCDELGHEPADVALAWLLAQPAVCSPIIGPRTVDQLMTSLPAIDVNLNSDQVARINAIFPGFKTAPEDYAW